MIINFNGLEVIAIKFTKSDIIMGYRISVHNIQHYYTAWLTGAECRIGNGEKLKQQQRPSRGRSETHLLVAAQIFPAAKNFPTVSFGKKQLSLKDVISTVILAAQIFLGWPWAAVNLRATVHFLLQRMNCQKIEKFTVVWQSFFAAVSFGATVHPEFQE